MLDAFDFPDMLIRFAPWLEKREPRRAAQFCVDSVEFTPVAERSSANCYREKRRLPFLAVSTGCQVRRSNGSSRRSFRGTEQPSYWGLNRTIRSSPAVGRAVYADRKDNASDFLVTHAAGHPKNTNKLAASLRGFESSRSLRSILSGFCFRRHKAMLTNICLWAIKTRLISDERARTYGR